MLLQTLRSHVTTVAAVAAHLHKPLLIVRASRSSAARLQANTQMHVSHCYCCCKQLLKLVHSLVFCPGSSLFNACRHLEFVWLWTELVETLVSSPEACRCLVLLCAVVPGTVESASWTTALLGIIGFRCCSLLNVLGALRASVQSWSKACAPACVPTWYAGSNVPQQTILLRYTSFNPSRQTCVPLPFGSVTAQR
jgi:hypothetical protein